MNKSKLKVGVIGLGVGERHADVYAADSRCELVSICDLNPEKLERVGQKYNSPVLTTDARDILTNSSIDLVSIASFDNFHYEQILLAIENDKHIFVEKPLCLHDSEFEQISMSLKDKPNIKISSNLVLRTAPHFLKVKEKIDSGYFGKLYYFEGDYNYGRIQKIISSWRGQIPFYSVTHGGAIHLIDLILWLSQEKITEAIAVGNKISTAESEFKYPDMVTALLKFSNGMTAKIAANFGCMMPHHHGLSVFGSKASYIKSFATEKYYTSRDSSLMPEEFNYEEKFRKDDILKSFVSSIIEGSEPLVSLSDVFNAMSVSLAIERSLKSLNWEKVSYLNY